MRQSRMVLGRTARRVPLVLKQEFSLVPVKGREKIGEYDSQTGYVVLCHIQSLVQESNCLFIRFKSGTEVRVYDNARILMKKIRTTRNVLERNE
jgi:hypothetical protein